MILSKSRDENFRRASGSLVLPEIDGRRKVGGSADAHICFRSFSCLNRNDPLPFSQQKHGRVDGGVQITAGIAPQINNNWVLSLPAVENSPELPSRVSDKGGNLNNWPLT